jgi:hypothetical protein
VRDFRHITDSAKKIVMVKENRFNCKRNTQERRRKSLQRKCWQTQKNKIKRKLGSKEKVFKFCKENKIAFVTKYFPKFVIYTKVIIFN